MMKVVMEDGEVMGDWIEVMKSGKKIKRMEVDFLSLGKYWDNVPKFVFEGYEKYFFQKFGVVAVSMATGVKSVDGFRGFQVGVMKNGIWFVMEADFSLRNVVTFVKDDKQVTTNAIVEGVKKNESV